MPARPKGHFGFDNLDRNPEYLKQGSNTVWTLLLTKRPTSELRESAVCDVQDKAGAETVWASGCCCQLNCPDNLLAQSHCILCIDTEKAAVIKVHTSREHRTTF